MGPAYGSYYWASLAASPKVGPIALWLARVQGLGFLLMQAPGE